MPRAHKGPRISSHQAQVWPFSSRCSPYLNRFPSRKSKPNGTHLLCPWGCDALLERRQEWNRHILTLHLPNNLYCPNPACPWRGSRKEKLNEHIEQGNCGARPKWGEQRMIYDVDLVLGWIRDGTISVDVAEMFAIDFVQERARELGKVDLWRDPWHYDGVDGGPEPRGL